MPKNDEALKKRVHVALDKGKSERKEQLSEHIGEGNSRKRKKGDDGSSQELEMSGVPLFLRDLLLALPSHSGPSYDSDAFVDQLRRTVLPPRPISEKGTGIDSKMDLSVGNPYKRKANDDDDENDMDIKGNFNDAMQDEFRRRRLMKMTK